MRLTIERRDVRIRIADGWLYGDLSIPEGVRGVVLFAHGSGSSRLSPRNRHVAGCLNSSAFATLLFDLLTEDEENEDMFTGRYRFDIELLSQRLEKATVWAEQDGTVAGYPIGYFGASTGAAAALVAASRKPDSVSAVVSRGGRPDLAGDALKQVRAPTLLIVGSNDPLVIDLNQQAIDVLPGEKSLRIVPGATHLFEEPGTLDSVARLAMDWFNTFLSG